jgi:DMSO/TMAO reductase YedYZ molybdopterin-dependent catalytic subunit
MEPVGVPERLPPGQREVEEWPVMHYGRVPTLSADTWTLTVSGATASGREHTVTYGELLEMPQSGITAGLHCGTGWSVLGLDWSGVETSVLLERFPAAAGCTHVLVTAQYGYSANMPFAAFAEAGSLLALTHDGAPLTPERGFPARLIIPSLYSWKGPKWVRAIEYLTIDRPGFWEERGWHPEGDLWREERYR